MVDPIETDFGETMIVYAPKTKALVVTQSNAGNMHVLIIGAEEAVELRRELNKYFPSVNGTGRAYSEISAAFTWIEKHIRDSQYICQQKNPDNLNETCGKGYTCLDHKTSLLSLDIIAEKCQLKVKQ